MVTLLIFPRNTFDDFFFIEVTLLTEVPSGDSISVKINITPFINTAGGSVIKYIQRDFNYTYTCKNFSNY